MPVSESDSEIPAAAPTGEAASAKGPVRIKKYANRRLYNTETSGYETLESLARMVRESVDFVVIDARTGEDLTRTVLTQIILEAESRGEHLMPMRFMRDLIRCYGENVQTLVPGYLEMSMDMLRKNHQSMCRAFETATVPFRQAEEAMRRNSQFFAQSFAGIVPGTAPVDEDGTGKK